MRINFLLFAIFFASISTTVMSQGDHRMSAQEKSEMPAYLLSRPSATNPKIASITPPSSPVRTIAEWEELQALVIGWKTYPTILREIVRAAKTETKVIIVYTSPDNVTSLTAYLAASGVDTINVVFLNASLNSVWSRDYGPWSAYTNDVDSLITIDWIYNRPRPQDDLVPVAISNYLGTPLYQTTTAPWNLIHTGGNFMTDGLGTGFSSNLIVDENPTLSIANIDTIMSKFMGINRYIKMQTLPYDAIHHIDMHMKLLNEETILMGEYPQGVADGPQIEANLQFVINNYTSPFGTPYKVIRIPMPPDNGLYPNTTGDYFTYTNSSFINKTIIVPTYNIPQDTTALRIYLEALPGYKVVGITSTQSISALGALHCITKEIGATNPLLIVHQPLPNTSDTTNDYTVNARIQHRTGIQSAIIYYRTDTIQPYFSSIMVNISGNVFSGVIPAQPAGTRIYYYIEATATSGKVASRPMPAPTAYWFFDVNGITAINEVEDLVTKSIFPNPARSITCIPFELTENSHVKCTLMDVGGREILRLADKNLNAGAQKLFLDASDYSPGVYMIRLETKKSIHVSSLVMIL